MKEKTILHVDVNNFFASVECATNPSLKGKPVAVTGNPAKRTGIILAKNELAKAQGVKTGEAIWEAKQKCPNLITVGPHYDLYEKISKQLQSLYLEYTDQVEPMGLDECWLDVTHSLNYLDKNGKQIADEIREKVKQTFGFTVSVGVSFSKLFAKLGSDLKKPDATTIIEFKDFKAKTYHLPLNSIVGVGRKLTQKFEKMNITTIGEYAKLDENFIKQSTNKTGFELWLKLRGEFDDPVANYFQLAPPKSIGNGTTTIVDIMSREDIAKVVKFLSEKISIRMSNENFLASTLSVSLKTANFKHYHHSKTISQFRSPEEIFEGSMSLIDSFWKYDQLIRAIRISVSSLENSQSSQQLSFFNKDDITLTESLQQIKNKYGDDKIFIASDGMSFINRKNKHEENYTSKQKNTQN